MTDTTLAVAERQRVTGRVRSIDIIRGAVMVLMAIDHVRVFSGVIGWCMIVMAGLVRLPVAAIGAIGVFIIDWWLSYL